MERLSDIEIGPFSSRDEAEIIVISVRAWTPVFEELEPAVPNYVFKAFYPDGWAARQMLDIRECLRDEGERTFVAKAAGAIVGWVGLHLHPQDRMGEIYTLAVDPACQRKGVAACLMECAKCEMRQAGIRIVMVETGDDPGHAASRATYENAGFRR